VIVPVCLELASALCADKRIERFPMEHFGMLIPPKLSAFVRTEQPLFRSIYLGEKLPAFFAGFALA
jgi:hypothetical protein